MLKVNSQKRRRINWKLFSEIWSYKYECNAITIWIVCFGFGIRWFSFSFSWITINRVFSSYSVTVHIIKRASRNRTRLFVVIITLIDSKTVKSCFIANQEFHTFDSVKNNMQTSLEIWLNTSVETCGPFSSSSQIIRIKFLRWAASKEPQSL